MLAIVRCWVTLVLGPGPTQVGHHGSSLASSLGSDCVLWQPHRSAKEPGAG